MPDFDRIDNALNSLSKNVETLAEKIDKIMQMMTGDPTDPAKPGFDIRIDRLEQANKLKNKILCLLASGIVPALGLAMLTAFVQLIAKQ